MIGSSRDVSPELSIIQPPSYVHVNGNRSHCSTACSSSHDENGTSDNVFTTDALQATIRRTTNGVPHIQADTLEAAAFGNGYAQAQDNVCQLAESIVKARSERALYFGPGPDNIHIVHDFSYQALRIYSGAVDELPALSQASRALLDGFVAGYNHYVAETAPESLPVQCRDQPWVRAISATDLLAHYRLIAQYASGDLFANGGVFLAVPPGVSVEPRTVVAGEDSAAAVDATGGSSIASDARRLAARPIDFTDTGSGSNAWGIGSVDVRERARCAAGQSALPVYRCASDVSVAPHGAWLRGCQWRRVTRYRRAADRFQPEPWLVAYGEHQHSFYRL